MPECSCVQGQTEALPALTSIGLKSGDCWDWRTNCDPHHFINAYQTTSMRMDGGADEQVGGRTDRQSIVQPPKKQTKKENLCES